MEQLIEINYKSIWSACVFYEDDIKAGKKVDDVLGGRRVRYVDQDGHFGYARFGEFWQLAHNLAGHQMKSARHGLQGDFYLLYHLSVCPFLNSSNWRKQWLLMISSNWRSGLFRMWQS